MAFHYFACSNVDWAVIETGMGGRLDATNVVRPEVTVITNISLDHCEFLGNTISDITFEKAGIMKQGVPLITSSQDSAVISQLSKIAQNLNSPFHVYKKDFNGDLRSMSDRHITLDYSGINQYSNLEVPLTGKYQLDNACTAIRVCEVLRAKGLAISDQSLEHGLKSVRLEGRLEWVSHSPPILLDGAHNPAASGLLASSIQEIFPDKRIILITGVMSDKDIKETIGPLIKIADSIILTKAQYERAATSDELKSIISDLQESGLTYKPISTVNTFSVSEAIDVAKSQCKEDSIVLITGSFYTTGEAKEVLGHKAILSRLRE
jgi:dihydrofolate synthase/folylpolyglutamate synthase